MPHQARAALRSHFGLGDVTWLPTPQGWVWGGVSGLGAQPANGNGSRDAAKRRFVDWLAAAYPGLVEELASRLDTGGAAGLGQTEQPGLLDRIMGAAEQILPAYLQYQQQRDVLEIQLERARAGLPPLDSGQYAPSVQVGLDQETVRRLGDEALARAGAGATAAGPWLILGGLALVAVFATMRDRKPASRRR